MSGLPKLVFENNKDEIVSLLQQGADVNEQDSNGHTALYCACRYNRTEIVEILLHNNNINVNLQSNSGMSPFSSACWNNSYECALLMLQDPRVDINLANNIGWSPLMRAGYTRNTELVQLLISFGRKIDIHKKTTKDYTDKIIMSLKMSVIKSGSTALDIAKQRNRTEVVQLLEQYINNPKETLKLWTNQLNPKGKK